MVPHLAGMHTCPSPHRTRAQTHTFAVPVQDIQGCDEELMGVLLLVPCQVPGVSPHQVQQLVWDVRGPMPRVKLLKRETKLLVWNKHHTLNTKHAQ